MPIEPVSMAAVVGQHVAEQVVGDDDVELGRRAHQLHRAVVGVHVAESWMSGVLGVVELAEPPRATARRFP